MTRLSFCCAISMVIGVVFSERTLAENLSVDVYKSTPSKAGYVDIGLDAVKAFVIAYASFKEHQNNPESYDSMFFTVDDDKITISFLMPPADFDGKSEYKVILDRTTLKVLNRP